MTDALIIFAKAAVPGMAKTRLIPLLGDQGAADAHAELVVRTLRHVGQWLSSARQDVDPGLATHRAVAQLWATSKTDEIIQWASLLDMSVEIQCAGDLGARMAHATSAAFAQGHSRVLLIGTDCPTLNAEHLTQAGDLLGHHDVVFAPAEDGGYGLIGLCKPHPELFANMPWSTSDVLDTSLAVARENGLTVALTQQIWDVDIPADWQRYLALKRSERRYDTALDSGPEAHE